MFTGSKGKEIKMQIHITEENYYSAAAALYWFCVNYHSGQDSVLYRIQCQLDYHPAMGEENLDNVIVEEMTENEEDK